MKKTLASSLLIAAVLAAAPLSSFAQSVTRAQVRADLVQVEKAGYNPATASDTDYPADIQAAEARIHAPATAQSASPYSPQADQSGPGSVYFGH